MPNPAKAARHDEPLTPMGLQSAGELARRRRISALVTGAAYLLLLAWLAQILGAGGWSVVDVLIFACFAIAAPWSVLGVWNALLGLWLLRQEDAWESVAAFASDGDLHNHIVKSTAILMTVRNEDPARAFARLETVKASIDATGEGALFSYYVLSDTSEDAVGAQEEAAFAAWGVRAGADAARLFYRRRTSNEGFKAGNLRDFCLRWGQDHEFMIPLDADSLMSGETILQMVRIGQAHPKLGILQSLVVGAPSQAAFARVFQFGMRHGMRPYTMGSAWWAGDCGPFWGHNALVRIAPFANDCHLPELPGKPPLGGQILSHDQVEAVLMRRAGYEVRVLPRECGSYEDNPPTLLDALKPFDGEDMALFPAASAIGLYCVFLLMYLAPKLAGFIDIMLTPGEMKRYGGVARFTAGCLFELAFSFLLGAATTLRTSLFMIGLLFGKSVMWNGQARDAHSLSYATAFAGLWPQTLFGALIFLVTGLMAPSLLLWSLPLTLGYLVAAPFAVMTASPGLGRFLAWCQLCALPEEIDQPEILRALDETIAKRARDGA